MKDYSMTKEEKEMFILNYEINEDKIIVNYAAGGKGIIPFTKENINKLQAKMKEQVRKSEDYKIKTECKITFYKLFILFLLIAIPVNFYPFIRSILDSELIAFSSFFFSNACIGSLFSVLSIFLDINMINNYKKDIKDIEKNKLFLNNEELLNEKAKSKENSLLNSEIKKENINDLETPIVNINTIEKMKYEKLKQILLEIKRNELLDFDYTQKEQQKTYVKK